MNQDTDLLERLKSEMRKLHCEVCIVKFLFTLAAYSDTGFRFWFFLMVIGLFSFAGQEYQIHGNQKPLGRASLYCGHVTELISRRLLTVITNKVCDLSYEMAAVINI